MKITAGDTWTNASETNFVTISRVDNIDGTNIVHYEWNENGQKRTHSKPEWNFRVRYHKKNSK
jgi:hypothetical protein